MTLRDVLLSPPVAGCVFLALVYGLYRLGGRLAAKGEEHPGKHQPYACGEDLLPPEAQLAYHAFFQLALMFALLHLATLVSRRCRRPASPAASRWSICWASSSVCWC